MRKKTRDVFRILAAISPFVFTLWLGLASAASANISHSYNSEGSITNGSLVSLDPSRSDYVEPANTNNGQQLLGIATASNDSLLAIDPSSSTVQVATSGTANTLVSTINGSIKVGDQISVSPLEGVGMKASPGAYVIGLAQTNLNSSTGGVITQSVKNKDGKVNQILVGYVRLGIAIGVGSTQGSGNQLNGLQQFIQSLTGHAVSTARIVVSLIIVIVALVSLVTLIYASIYSGIISIGRNPLAKYAVLRSVTSVLGMVILIAVVAGITVFSLLR